MTARAEVGLVDLGRRPYAEALDLQRRLCRARLAGRVDQDLVLLVEHDPVVTLGRGTRDASLPLGPDLLRARGVDVFEVERGGDVTLHAPGQLVVYPILDLAGYRPDLHWYLRRLEEWIIRGLAGFDLAAERRAGLTGVWTRGRKIASIGIHVKRWVTFHGLALNVTTDLTLFDLIVPCGIDGVTMTSVARETRRSDESALWGETTAEMTAAFGEVFDRQLTPAELPLAALAAEG